MTAWQRIARWGWLPLATAGLVATASCGSSDAPVVEPELPGDTTPQTPGDTTTGPSADGFVRVQGSNFVRGDGGPRIYLRGINLSFDRVSASFCGAGEWREADYTDWGEPVTCWYQEKHFALLRDIGFNVVRVNLSYRIFEDNAAPGVWKESGWELIDRLVAWGDANGIDLILDMHVAPGGAGIVQCLGCGYRTWDDPSFQARFQALWREIARRYVDEPRIAAFDLLNEPVPTESVAQWQALAQSTIDAIREVDTNHVVIVEMVNWIYDRDDRSPLQDLDSQTLRSFQFLVNDPQTAYDFHYYLPTRYTLQFETGVDGGSYPDDSLMETTFGGASAPRNADFLRGEMQTVDAFWKENLVPANFGEWGTQGSRGGDRYAMDMLSLMDAEALSWQFYFIHHLYDIQCCFDDNPTAVRSPELIEAFRGYFR
jgi:endoglucanase